MPELATIYDYMRAHATMLGERILQEYPALHPFDAPISPRIDQASAPTVSGADDCPHGRSETLGAGEDRHGRRRMRNRQDPDFAGSDSRS